MPSYLFDPIQYKEFGYDFFNGIKASDPGKFSYRYQTSKLLGGVGKRIYIPLGPFADTKQDFIKFLDHCKKFKRTKLIIDLPIIYDAKIKKEVIEQLVSNGFRKREYIQDDETLVLNRQNYTLKSHHLNKVHYGERFFDIKITDKLTDEELNRIYEIYLISSKRIDFKPKSIDIFKVMMGDSLSALAISKDTKLVEGFVFCYYHDFFTKGLTILTDKEMANILLVMFTAASDYGRDKRVGYVMHKVLFDYAFADEKTDLIDFHGASRKQGKIYVDFKQSFGGEFLPLGGSFEKLCI